MFVTVEVAATFVQPERLYALATQPACQVVTKVGDAASGIGLIDQLVESIVPIAPQAHVCVVHLGLSSGIVVPQFGLRPAHAGGLQPVCCVVGVGHPRPFRRVHFDRPAPAVAARAGGVVLWIGDAGPLVRASCIHQDGVGRLRCAPIRGCHLHRSAQQVEAGGGVGHGAGLPRFDPLAAVGNGLVRLAVVPVGQGIRHALPLLQSIPRNPGIHHDVALVRVGACIRRTGVVCQHCLRRLLLDQPSPAIIELAQVVGQLCLVLVGLLLQVDQDRLGGQGVGGGDRCPADFVSRHPQLGRGAQTIVADGAHVPVRVDLQVGQSQVVVVTQEALCGQRTGLRDQIGVVVGIVARQAAAASHRRRSSHLPVPGIDGHPGRVAPGVILHLLVAVEQFAGWSMVPVVTHPAAVGEADEALLPGQLAQGRLGPVSAVFVIQV